MCRRSRSLTLKHISLVHHCKRDFKSWSESFVLHYFSSPHPVVKSPNKNPVRDHVAKGGAVVCQAVSIIIWKQHITWGGTAPALGKKTPNIILCEQVVGMKSFMSSFQAKSNYFISPTKISVFMCTLLCKCKVENTYLCSLRPKDSVYWSYSEPVRNSTRNEVGLIF